MPAKYVVTVRTDWEWRGGNFDRMKRYDSLKDARKVAVEQIKAGKSINATKNGVYIYKVRRNGWDYRYDCIAKVKRTPDTNEYQYEHRNDNTRIILDDKGCIIKERLPFGL